MNEANTIQGIADRLGVTIYRVQYVVKSRNIPPRCKIGNTRVFSEEAALLIARELGQKPQRAAASA